jgi:hypothetical protein
MRSDGKKEKRLTTDFTDDHRLRKPGEGLLAVRVDRGGLRKILGNTEKDLVRQADTGGAISR